jgi:hypothetical protein
MKTLKGRLLAEGTVYIDYMEVLYMYQPKGNHITFGVQNPCKTHLKSQIVEHFET